ncbi:hypothetical protein NHX12_025178 [Muraenolepis orangiensis]|uniref:Rho-GAP domain-containing protein n=1 Tax=Muraenolepis orangiensis TaxID=630683 RepID=A0A9Q0IS07_9TELE|nr:hypothetical protein NHX12_025178 [Muraenolepis orangiensis]
MVCVCVCLDVFVVIETPSSSSSRVIPAPPSSGQHITVAKKQQWAQQGSGRDAQASGVRPCVQSSRAGASVSPPCGAYLQSRPTWVLSSGKAQASEEASRAESSRKKVGVSSSMIDRLKSPGTVRKLSMKMKKLPELRRKLSLRSSRSHRHGNKVEDNEESDTHKETPSFSSNQNVLSRYHLDSSAPPARPVRRSSRGRCSKGGYLSDGDSPELLPRQPAAPQATPPDGGYDVTSFRLYVGSDQPRCAQRVSGLLTVHLLGLDQMSRTRCEAGGKEVFLAIQVDGVTRGRTALLTLRGVALPLNHTFHLQLERARQLRLVVLTPHANTAVKKELRDSFEKDSSAVCLSEEQYPDINVLTGILKDYLRALPSPLITQRLYDDVLTAMRLRPLLTGHAPLGSAHSPVELLDCLPPPEKATLSLLLDHLSRVASFRSSNRMTPQNLAVCFGPVLLASTDGPTREGGRDLEVVSAVDFKRHIEVLHYLLALWPVPLGQEEEVDAPPLYSSLPSPPPSPSLSLPSPSLPGRAPLRLALPQNPHQQVVVSRRGRGLGRLDSPPPINRYAGDWSVCGRDFLSGQDADYDEVAGSESEEGRIFLEEFDAPFSCRLSLNDFDRLILDLDRELAKQINICL